MPQRLIVLILLPTVAAVALAGLRISDAAAKAEAYGRVHRMAELGTAVTRFVQEFTAERDQTAEFITAGRAPAMLANLQAQQRRADALVGPTRTAASRIDASYGSDASRDAGAVISRLDGVKALRSLAIDSQVPATTVLDKYSESVGELIELLDGISQNVADDDLAQSSRALGSLARAKEAVSRERALLLIGARNGRLATDELTALTAARAQEDSEIQAFRGSASLRQRQLFDDTVVGTRVDQAKDLRQRVIASATTTAGGRVPTGFAKAGSLDVLRGSMTDMINQMRKVEGSIAGDITSDSERQGTDARNSVIAEAVAVAVLLLIVLLVTTFMARSLVRPLRRLQSGALDIAGTRLPGLVDRLRDPEAAAGGIEVEPIEIDSTDEIGQVARAFDEVHREAVRLAADEAVLRGNINAMFVNLSRRSQSLIERQLKLIEELEQSERDEDQLANLFRLDHLATRMRRNCENLLVLGGQEQARRWNQPVPLIDVVRASLSEVEEYERVALRVQGDMTVAGPVVNDLVHLLAELVENATAFSAEHTKVTVSGQLLSGGGSMLQITDNGVGMSPEELEQANWRLANPPVIDFSAARRMGLFVVGRLAVRHGVRVELRAAQGGGLTAFVVLPEAVVSPGEHAGIGARGFGSRDAAVPTTGPLSALTSQAEPPVMGAGGGFSQDEFGPAAQAGPGVTGRGTGAQPFPGGTGPQRPVRRATGPQPVMGNTGAQPIVGTGPVPSIGNTGGYPAIPATGPVPIVPPAEPRTPGRRPAGPGAPGQGDPAYGAPAPGDLAQGDDMKRGPGDLPVRKPGAQLPGSATPRPEENGQTNGLFQPRSEWLAGGGPAGGNGSGRHRPGQTGPLPVVSEAQPVVPDPGSRRHIPWETGPLNQVGDDPGRETGAPYADNGYADDGTYADPSPSSARPRLPDAGPAWGEPGGPAQLDRPDPEPAGFRPRFDRPGPGPAGSAPMPPEESIPQPPAREMSGNERIGRNARPAPPAQAPQSTPRFPERSPIFDAMQSEWFHRRTGKGGEDPVKGWESPADAGFRAAEAVREPVAGTRTAVGLPKRVPGKNRVPGAVGRATAPAEPRQASARPVQGGAAPGQQGHQARQGQSQSADVVRNRFASLQRGVHRGRTETRDGGMSGEPPQQGGGETGGPR